MDPLILNHEVQRFLVHHQANDLTRLILNGSPFKGVSPQELAQQIEGRKKAATKLPVWFNATQIYYPPKVNLEQTSSQATASYKASLARGEKMADLTGGFGVDSYFFALKIDEVHYVETNPELATIAQHNFKILGAKNILCHQDDGIEFLKSRHIQFDTIYVDPSRRNEAKGKVFLLEDCEPNLPENLELLSAFAKRIMVKTSPLLDISAGLKVLINASEIHIVAVNNEVKELLWVLDAVKANKFGERDSLVERNENRQNKVVKSQSEPSRSNTKIIAVNLKQDETETTAVNLNDAYRSQATFSLPEKYLYEPNAALMKSGLFEWIGEHYGLGKLHQNTQLYTSNQLKEFPGRVFEINEILPYTKKAILKRFSGTTANVTTRNFRESVDQLRKKFKIGEGGHVYLFFTTTMDDEGIVVVCGKVGM